MLRWDSYRTVYGAELRAAAREYSDHGWIVVGGGPAGLLLATGTSLDVLEMPAAVGRLVCAQLRAADIVVPVAATPTGSWWYPVTPGAALPAALRGVPGVVLHGGGAAIAAPPSQVPDGWVHWRVPPAACDYGVAPAHLIFSAAVTAMALRVDDNARPGAQRPAGVVTVGGRP